MVLYLSRTTQRKHTHTHTDRETAMHGWIKRPACRQAWQAQRWLLPQMYLPHMRRQIISFSPSSRPLPLFPLSLRKYTHSSDSAAYSNKLAITPPGGCRKEAKKTLTSIAVVIKADFHPESPRPHGWNISREGPGGRKGTPPMLNIRHQATMHACFKCTFFLEKKPYRKDGLHYTHRVECGKKK